MTEGDQVGVQRVRLTTLKDGAVSSLLFGKRALKTNFDPLPVKAVPSALMILYSASFFVLYLSLATLYSLTYIFMLLVFFSLLFLVVIITK